MLSGLFTTLPKLAGFFDCYESKPERVPVSWPYDKDIQHDAEHQKRQTICLARLRDKIGIDVAGYFWLI